jgi:hypothetical protein
VLQRAGEAEAALQPKLLALSWSPKRCAQHWGRGRAGQFRSVSQQRPNHGYGLCVPEVDRQALPPRAVAGIQPGHDIRFGTSGQGPGLNGVQAHHLKAEQADEAADPWIAEPSRVARCPSRSELSRKLLVPLVAPVHAVSLQVAQHAPAPFVDRAVGAPEHRAGQARFSDQCGQSELLPVLTLQDQSMEDPEALTHPVTYLLEGGVWQAFPEQIPSPRAPVVAAPKSPGCPEHQRGIDVRTPLGGCHSQVLLFAPARAECPGPHTMLRFHYEFMYGSRQDCRPFRAM